MNKVFAFGILVMALAGCATGATGGGSGAAGGAAAADPAAAKRLAAELNALTAGSAKANGGTVTLTDDVTLETALTVPAGVTLSVPASLTLDLIKETLSLGGNAALTVDGTVNVRGAEYDGVEGGLRFNGTATINGSGTIYLKSKGMLLDIGADRKLTLDGITLVGLEDNNDSLVLVYEGGELVMKGGAITGNTRIAGKEWAGGGGVQVGEGSTFTMEGGEISGNTVKGKWSYGGGAYVEGAFIMNGGKISGNIAYTDGDHTSGGGVSVQGVGEAATFILAGGEISGNTVIHDGIDSGQGGGVHMQNALFTMKGGAISGNSVTAQYSSGGGVTVDERATFIMEGGAISGNSANGAKWGAGGGVEVNGGMGDVSTATFIMKGGRIQGGEDSGGFTKNIGPSEGSAAISVWNSTVQWGTGGAYTKGGAAQAGGGDILSIPAKVLTATDDTLIAEPAK
jgi:hypothetical protein